MTFKVYIAAPFPLLKDAVQLRAQLAVVGIESTARWIDLNQKAEGQTAIEYAQHDLDDVRAAHAVVLINPPMFANKGTGGRHVEIGYALGIGHPFFFVMGVKSNIFHELPQALIVATVTELVAEIHGLVAQS